MTSVNLNPSSYTHQWSANLDAQPGLANPGPVSPNYQSVPDQLDDPNDVTAILAARMGSLRIAEDGQLRYYGSTSNLHLHRCGYPSLSDASIRHVATEGLAVLQRMGLDQDVPLSLEEHFSKLYFAWEDPAIHCVDEQIFFEEKQKSRDEHQTTPYYSETLNNAMRVAYSPLESHENSE